MTVYDLSFTNSTNPVDLAKGINTASGGVLGAGICLVLYFIIIKSSLDNNYDIGVSLLASSFILSIISGLLLGLGLLPDYVLGMNVFILVCSVFITIFGRGR